MYNIETILNVYNLKYKKSYSNRQISRKLNISHTTINNWVNLLFDNINVYTERIKKIFLSIYKKKEHNKFFENIEIINFINKLIEINPFIYINEIINKVYHIFQIKLQINNVRKIIKQLNLTRKKPKFYVVKNKEYIEDLQKKRMKFIEEINSKNFNRIISIDESGFKNNLDNIKGLSEKGKKCIINVGENKSKNYTLILAITNYNVLNYSINECSTNTNIFYNFIKDTINKLEKNEKYIFLFDNVPFHKSKIIKELIETNGHTIMYTPPYSPNNNPVESYFSLIKNIYRKKLSTNIVNFKIKKNIILSIEETIKNYSKITLQNLFNRSFKFSYVDIYKECRDRFILSEIN